MINCLSTCLTKFYIDDNVEKLLKTRFIYESDENYPKDALHIHAQNELAIESNETF